MTVNASNKGVKKCCMCHTRKVSVVFDGKYCSLGCQMMSIEYTRIIFPKIYIKNLIFRFDNEEKRKNELVKYANRHKFNVDLVLSKANNLITSIIEDKEKKCLVQQQDTVLM